MDNKQFKINKAKEHLQTTFYMIRAVYEHYAVHRLNIPNAMERFYRFLYYKEDFKLEKNEQLQNKINFDINNAKCAYDNLVKNGTGDFLIPSKNLIMCGYSASLFRTDSPTSLKMGKVLADNIGSDDFEKILCTELDYIQNVDNTYLVLTTLNLIKKIREASIPSDLKLDYLSDIESFNPDSAKITNSVSQTAYSQDVIDITEIITSHETVKINLLLLRETYKLMCEKRNNSMELFYKYLCDTNRKINEATKSKSSPYARFFDEYLRTGNGNINYMLERLDECGFDMTLFDSKKPSRIDCDDSLYIFAYNYATQDIADATTLKEFQTILAENIESMYDSQNQLFAESVRALVNAIQDFDSEYWDNFVEAVTDITYEHRLTQKQIQADIIDMGKQYNKINSINS